MLLLNPDADNNDEIIVGNRKLTSTVQPIQGNNQLLVIVGGEGDKKRGMIVEDGMIDKGQGGGNLVTDMVLMMATAQQGCWKQQQHQQQ